MIGILGALDIEVARLYEELEDKVVEEAYGYKYARGKLCGKDVVVARCGVGKVNAAVCAQTMVMKYAPELVINSGVAGSLSKELDILDIAVGKDVVQHDFDTTGCGDPVGYVSTVGQISFPCDEKASAAILEAAKELGLNARLSRIASGDQFITARARKQWIVDTFGAMACEMEAGAIAQVCYIAGTKCAVIRAISDATDDAHGMEFFEFAARAAENSIKVLKKALMSEIL
jgi:adenosylhomocysteine nucleosidase